MVTFEVTMQPLLSLTHQLAFITLDGLGGAVYWPVALNWICPPEVGATAVEGVTAIDCSRRVPLMPPPQLRKGIARKQHNAASERDVYLFINTPPG